MRLEGGRVLVRVPATSANLGPGYDALGLALDLHDEVRVEVVPGEPGSVSLSVEGEGSDTVPRDGEHLVHRALSAALGARGVEVPALRMHCVNAIPHGRGLGSSAAAVVAGIVAARGLLGASPGEWTDADVLRLAADVEGHPDNVAATVLGGLTIAYGEPGSFAAVRLDVRTPLRFVVLVPPWPLATSVARGLLPPTVPHRDAGFNLGRAALLVSVLSGAVDEAVVLAATEDRLHQAQRAPAMPDSTRLVGRLREAGHAAVVSGAGPTVLVMAPADQVPAVVAQTPEGWRVSVLDVDAAGVTVQAG